MTTKKKRVKSGSLALELIPATMWGKNVRAVISRESWGALRWGFYATVEKPEYMKIRFHHRHWTPSVSCNVCGAERDSLELHEEWQYDDKRLIQRLAGLIAVCEDCHLSMHLGRANLLQLGDKAKQHLSKVNRWTDEQTKKHIKAAFRIWERRSNHQYSLDLRWLHRWIPESKIHLAWLKQPKHWVGDRLDAILWAQEILESDAVIVDTETTGLLDYSRVEVIELAVITMRGKLVYHSRFRPRYKIPKHTD